MGMGGREEMPGFDEGGTTVTMICSPRAMGIVDNVPDVSGSSLGG